MGMGPLYMEDPDPRAAQIKPGCVPVSVFCAALALGAYRLGGRVAEVRQDRFLGAIRAFPTHGGSNLPPGR